MTYSSRGTLIKDENFGPSAMASFLHKL